MLRRRHDGVVRRGPHEPEPLSAERVRAGRPAQRALVLLPRQGRAGRRRRSSTPLLTTNTITQILPT